MTFCLLPTSDECHQGAQSPPAVQGSGSPSAPQNKHRRLDGSLSTTAYATNGPRAGLILERPGATVLLERSCPSSLKNMGERQMPLQHVPFTHFSYRVGAGLHWDRWPGVARDSLRDFVATRACAPFASQATSFGQAKSRSMSAALHQPTEQTITTIFYHFSSISLLRLKSASNPPPPTLPTRTLASSRQRPNGTRPTENEQPSNLVCILCTVPNDRSQAPLPRL